MCSCDMNLSRLAKSATRFWQLASNPPQQSETQPMYYRKKRGAAYFLPLFFSTRIFAISSTKEKINKKKLTVGNPGSVPWSP